MTDPDPNFIIAPASKHRRAKEELRDFDNRIESSLPCPGGAVEWDEFAFRVSLVTKVLFCIDAFNS